MASNGVVKTYDPNKIVMTFKGIIFTDFADGTFVNFTQDDGFEDVRGADGSLNRINKNVNDGTIETSLSQTSVTNDALSAVHKQDKLTNQGKGPLTIKDTNGTTLFFSPQAWIIKYPDSELGDSLTTRTWAFRCAQLETIVGGNI